MWGKKRKANEDYFGSFKGEYGSLFIVCDGMGGYKGGRTASTTAVETIKNHFSSVKADANMRTELYQALKKADAEIVKKAQEDPELGRMGTTAVIALIQGSQLFIAHIGDSRAYRVRDEEIERLTRDHSFVEELVASAVITPEQAENHPKKNVILRSLGPNGDSEPEVDARDEVLFKDDIIVLCSDGLTGHVDDKEIRDIVLKNNPVKACEELVALANNRGGNDNITVQVIKVAEGKKRALSLKQQAMVKQLYGTVTAIILVIILWFILANNSKIAVIQKDNDSKGTPTDSTGTTSGSDKPDSGGQK